MIQVLLIVSQRRCRYSEECRSDEMCGRSKDGPRDVCIVRFVFAHLKYSGILKL